MASIVDTLVVFYHPARPGLHKRLRAEYRHPPAYVEASHPAAALLDGEQHGWSVAALAITPITETVYYWEETLKEANDAKTLYNLAPSAYAKRLDLYIPPRLAKTVEVATVPTPGENAGWRFQATPAHTLLHTLLHIIDWSVQQPLRKTGPVRLYAEVSLAPPHVAKVIGEATRLTAMLLAAARNQPVEHAVYTAPQPPSHTRRPPLIDLQELERRVYNPVEALRSATLEALAETPHGHPLAPRGPKARPPRELQRRLQRLAEKARSIAAVVAAALPHAALALACTEQNPLNTLHRILAEAVEADLENTTLQKYREGGVVAHHLEPNPTHLKLAMHAMITSAALARQCSLVREGIDPEELPRLAAQLPTPAAETTASAIQRLLAEKPWQTTDPKKTPCNDNNIHEAITLLLLHPATIEERNGKLHPKTECIRAAAKQLAKP
ncbi:hypothetical protein [Pyrolobus fumarii]|uniref:hypothetical protein n=1 Tax=Pyrolobus fumarii TaxID=54252 RepID=UPI00064FDA59|nr:hypothetical protein [Pyrolobus fumarii]